MALAKILSRCVGPGSQAVLNAAALQHVITAAGIRGLDTLYHLLHTAPAAADVGTVVSSRPQQQQQLYGTQTSQTVQQARHFSSSSSSRSSSSSGSSSSSSRRPSIWALRSSVLSSNPGSSSSPGAHAHYSAAVAATAAAEVDAAADESAAAGQLSTQEYRKKYSMWVLPADAPAPFQTFEQAELPQGLLKALLKHGFTAPTFIQAQAWPIAFEGRDLVAIASTGSGKTAGFLLPAFLHIRAQQLLQEQHAQQTGKGSKQQQQQGRGGKGWSRWNDAQAWGSEQLPVALVLAPTRELAQQTQQEAERLGSRIKTACLYGGASKGMQARQLQRGPQLIIATPGRLLDFVNAGEVNLSRVSMLVLDEADRMLDMGFEPQIRDLLSFMPGGEYALSPRPDELPVPPRQTLFFSATWPKEVQAIARKLCRNDPVQVFVGNVQEKLVANRDVTQHVAMLSNPLQRLPAVLDYLHEHLHGAEHSQGSVSSGSHSSHSRDKHAAEHPSAVLDADVTHPRVVIFAETKRECDNLAYQLSKENIRAVAVHGDKSQNERDHALRSFRQGRVPVLVATDVAARGLDIPGVTAVINYSFPSDHEMYIHRIGRTGRAGRKGESLTLLTPADAAVTPVLVDIMRDAGQVIPPELEAAAARVRKPAQNKHRYGSGGGSRGGYGRGGGSRGGGYGSRGSSWGSRGGGGGRSDRYGGGGRRGDSWGGGGGNDRWSGGDGYRGDRDRRQGGGPGSRADGDGDFW